MRSRPRVDVLLRPGRAAAGEELQVEVLLTSRSVTPVDFVDVRLVGTLRAFGNLVRAGTVPYQRTLLALGARPQVTSLRKGETRLRVAFRLPPHLPPTFIGEALAAAYDLRVHVSIPWWPDKVAAYEVPIVLRGAAISAGTALVYESPLASPQLQVAFEGLTLRPGDVLAGTVTTRHLASRDAPNAIRSLELHLQSRERDVPTGLAVAGRSYSLALLDRSPLEGERVPFRLRLPVEMAPSFTSALASLEWSVSLRAVTRVGQDAVLAVPLVVAPVPTPQKRTNAAPPSVDVERRRVMWAAVAEARGLAFDPARGGLRAKIDGVSVSIDLEGLDGDDEKQVLAARIAFPSLAIGLHLAERRLIDFFARRTALPLPAAEERLVAHGREDHQVVAFLTSALLTDLLSFHRVSVEDTHAHLFGRGAGKSRELLAAFVDRVLAVARQIAVSARELPPPRALREHADAWRAYAERLHGVFRVGDGSIVEASVEGQAVEVHPVLGSDGDYEGTLVRVAIDPPLALAPSVDDPALSPLARSLLRDLLAETRGDLDVASTAIEWQVDGALADPATLDARLQTSARLVRALRGLSASGPFR